VKRDFFAEDFKFLRVLGDTVDLHEVRVELLDFQDANFTKRTRPRVGLKVRISAGKAQALAVDLFAQKKRP
jgi:hypothetical protein